MSEHKETCYLTEHRPCPAGKSLHGEPEDSHWFSGWPGAWCMKCGDEDKMELCIGTVCSCHCHDEFWNQLQAEQPPAEMDESAIPF